MGLVECASGASCWRGLDYYKEGKVLTASPVSTSEFEGRVQGTAEEPYDVRINIAHPRKSSCNCPHAKDRRVICKHQIALYFEVEPGAAEFFEQDQARLEEEYHQYMQQRRRDRFEEIVQYVDGLDPDEMRQELINALVNADEEYDRERYW